MMKTGWTWKSPDGRMGVWRSSERKAQGDAMDEESKGTWGEYKDGPELAALGWRIVPVVMVEIPDPDADGHCSSDCPFRWESPADPDWMACQLQRGVKDGDDMKPDPARCPAGKGGGG